MVYGEKKTTVVVYVQSPLILFIYDLNKKVWGI